MKKYRYRIHIWTSGMECLVYSPQVKRWWGWQTIWNCYDKATAYDYIERHQANRCKEGFIFI